MTTQIFRKIWHICAKILSDLIEKEVATVLDPTLLLDAEEWNNYLGISNSKTSRYLLAYFLGNNDKHWKTTYQLAEKLNLPVKIIPVFPADLKRNGAMVDGVSPKDFVEYIQNADYVCTDSTVLVFFIFCRESLKTAEIFAKIN